MGDVRLPEELRDAVSETLLDLPQLPAGRTVRQVLAMVQQLQLAKPVEPVVPATDAEQPAEEA
jgi:hypothetical protein